MKQTTPPHTTPFCAGLPLKRGSCARKEDAEAYGAHRIAQFEEQLAKEFSLAEFKLIGNGGNNSEDS